MQIARLVFVSAAAVLSLACATVRVSTDYDDTVDFSSLESYAWLDPPMRETARDEGGPSNDPFTQNTLVDKRVRDEVDAWLAAHGYRQARADEQPDFMVRWDLVSQQVTHDSPVFVTGGFGGYGHGHSHGYGVGSGVGYASPNTYQEGTLILDVIEPDSQQLLWRGSGTSQARDPHMKPERLRKSVNAILERFPPKPKTGS